MLTATSEIYTAGHARDRAVAARRRPRLASRITGRSEPAAASRLAIADTNGDGSLELLATFGGRWNIVDAVASASNRVVAAVAAGGTDAAGGWAVAHLDVAKGPSVDRRAGERCAGDAGTPDRDATRYLGRSSVGPRSGERPAPLECIGARRARGGSNLVAMDRVRNHASRVRSRARVCSQRRSDWAARRAPTSWPSPGPTVCFKPSWRSTRAGCTALPKRNASCRVVRCCLRGTAAASGS